MMMKSTRENSIIEKSDALGHMISLKSQNKMQEIFPSTLIPNLLVKKIQKEIRRSFIPLL